MPCLLSEEESPWELRVGISSVWPGYDLERIRDDKLLFAAWTELATFGLELGLTEPESCGLIGAVMPLADWISEQRGGSESYFLGVSGAQGTGKSTLVNLLGRALSRIHGLRTVTLSLDDFYMTQAERDHLAQTSHPLFATRGVPGTHDIGMLMECISRLRLAETVSTPCFDKSVDDRLPIEKWQHHEGAYAVILLEGWCLGASAQESSQLEEPVNSLEREEDADCNWRRAINNKLAAGGYPELFSEFDAWLYMQVPDFDSVRKWRMRQEKDLIARVGEADAVMDTSGLRRFIMFYERITRHMLQNAPSSADIVFSLNPDHSVNTISLKTVT